MIGNARIAQGTHPDNDARKLLAKDKDASDAHFGRK